MTTAEARIATLEKLTRASIENHYNVYTKFSWPETVSSEAWWMSPELMSVHGTAVASRLDEACLKRLSKWETINFFSINIHGIRELITEVTRRLHVSGYEEFAEFFHRFIGEENDHMWFFAHFCNKYAAKIYADKALKFDTEGLGDTTAESLLIFARIVIIEEIVDYFNTKMGKDTRLPAILQEINWVHHEDESRHISGGRQIVRKLHGELVEAKQTALLEQVDGYIQRYMLSSIDSLYNPRMYADAEIPQPHAVRRELLADPARKLAHRDILKRTLGFFHNAGIVSKAELV